MKTKRDEISHMVYRAGRLGLALASQSLSFVLCHADIHPGNLLISGEETKGHPILYIVDWDNPVFAPKERDLVLIGGSFTWNDAREAGLFYQGYSQAKINQKALAYYRYERIIQDITVECEQVLTTVEGGDNRERACEYMISNFLPGHEIEFAVQIDVSSLA